MKQFRFCILLLSGLLLILSGCGSPSSSGSGGSTPVAAKPDRVHIIIDQITLPPNPPSDITLTDPTQVQRLYNTISALPALPDTLACTMERGPHYTLTFFKGNTTLMTAVAKREGCGPVSITGEKGDRQASADLWQLLDQARAR